MQPQISLAVFPVDKSTVDQRLLVLVEHSSRLLHEFMITLGVKYLSWSGLGEFERT